jgi:hypothetical protein
MGKKIPADLQGEYLIGALERLVRLSYPNKKEFSINRPVGPDTMVK